MRNKADHWSRGTGASCIYPLLGCRLRQGWRFGATGLCNLDFLVRRVRSFADGQKTDVDEKNLQFARANVGRNGFEKRVRLMKTEGEGALLPLDTLGFDRYGLISSLLVFSSLRSTLYSNFKRAVYEMSLFKLTQLVQKYQ